MYCMEHHQPQSQCPCSKEVTERIDEAITSMQIAAHQIILLKRDKAELLQAMKTLIEACHADPDTTKKFLEANQAAAAIIQKHTI